jgi:hypothetical protein
MFSGGPCQEVISGRFIEQDFPRVEAGKNTSIVIPVSRKRRQKGNPVVSDETVMYVYETSATLTTDRLHYKLQTCSLVRKNAPRRRAKQFSSKRKEKVKFGHGPQRGARHQDILTDWPSVVKQLQLWQDCSSVVSWLQFRSVCERDCQLQWHTVIQYSENVVVESWNSSKTQWKLPAH